MHPCTYIDMGHIHIHVHAETMHLQMSMCRVETLVTSSLNSGNLSTADCFLWAQLDVYVDWPLNSRDLYIATLFAVPNVSLMER